MRLEGKPVELGHFDTEREAEGVIGAFFEEVDRCAITPDVATLRTYGEGFLDRRELAGKRNIRNDRSRWQLPVLAAPFANKPLEEIARAEVRDWVHGLLRRRATKALRTRDGIQHSKTGRTLSSQTVKHVLNLLRRALQEAMDDGLIAANPASGISVPSRATGKETWTYLERDEIDRIAQCEGIPEPRASFSRSRSTPVCVPASCGACAGRMSTSTARCRASSFATTARGRPSTARSAGSRCGLAPPQLSGAGASSRTATASPGPPITGGCHAEGYDAGWADVKLANSRRDGFNTKAGIARRVRFHGLRHTCASHLVSGTWGRAWRLEEVCEYLGHSAITVTQRYAHLAPGALKQAMLDTACEPSQAPAEPAAGIPTVSPRSASASSVPANTPAISLALPEGFEPSTFGLGIAAEGARACRTVGITGHSHATGHATSTLLHQKADGKATQHRSSNGFLVATDQIREGLAAGPDSPLWIAMGAALADGRLDEARSLWRLLDARMRDERERQAVS